jgi:hypothetical protein
MTHCVRCLSTCVLADGYGKIINTYNHTVSAKALNARQAEAVAFALFRQDLRFDLRTVTLDANLPSRLCPGDLINLSYSSQFYCDPTPRLCAKHPIGSVRVNKQVRSCGLLAC